MAPERDRNRRGKEETFPSLLNGLDEASFSMQNLSVVAGPDRRGLYDKYTEKFLNGPVQLVASVHADRPVLDFE